MSALTGEGLDELRARLPHAAVRRLAEYLIAEAPNESIESA